MIGNDLLRLAPLFAVGLAITLADLASYASIEPLALGYSAPERVLIAARALWFYAGKLVWPADLAGIYPLWEVRAGDALGWVYVAAAAGLAAALWLARHRMGRGPLAGAVFFAVTLSPVLGFVDYGYMQYSLVANRFQYLAGIGVTRFFIYDSFVSKRYEVLRATLPAAHGEFTATVTPPPELEGNWAAGQSTTTARACSSWSGCRS